jgi:polyisoprenoid-binding protein YceI
MKWAVDPNHSSVSFTIRHLMSRVRGEMKVKEGWIETESDDLSKARVEAVLDASTIDTGVEARDNHLRSADGHFDVANYPTITFKSSRIVGNDPSSFKVVGDLTIHGVTREVALDGYFHGEAKDNQGRQRRGFSATGTIRRSDFGVGTPPGAPSAVADELQLTIDSETINQE